jgi:hypothetical protein
VKERSRKIERQHMELMEEQAKFLDRNSLETTHLKEGIFDIKFGKAWPESGNVSFRGCKGMGSGSSMLRATRLSN